MPKKTLRSINVADKAVLVRVDYNVPFRPGTVEISDDVRIRASLPTVRYLLENRCRVVLCSHLGRPRGKVVEALRMGPVADRAFELLGVPVERVSDCVGAEVTAAVSALSPGGVLMLENLRFHAEEESNNAEFAAQLASLADIYVNDAFGTAHRAHASTEGVTRHLPSVAGFLMARELEMLGQALESPSRPFVAILGGAKVSDKIAVLQNLSDTVDGLIIGGGMAATFLKATGLNTGDSPVEEKSLQFANDLIRRSGDGRFELRLPVDVIIADSFSAAAGHRTVGSSEIPSGWQIMDIGPKTISLFEEVLEGSSTVVWNGPLGVFEWQPYASGTTAIAKLLANLNGAITVVGGGSTAEAVDALGLSDRMTHVSTGGGASLEFLDGKTLPGVAALLDDGDSPSLTSDPDS